MLSDMFASVKSNDMASFKAFLDEDAKELDGEVSAIQYDYGITPLGVPCGRGRRRSRAGFT